MDATPSVDLKIEVAQLSDPGRDPNKQINEDSCGYAQTRFGHLCVLCDGMGGHYGGQEASRRAITTIFEQIDQAPPGSTPAQALKYSIEVAARRVYELGGPPDNKVRPGSTVVAMLLHDDGVDVAHVGDSRAYVIRSGQIYPLTRDHSMVQAMIDAGFITEEQAIGHPDANKITRALGMKPDVDVEVRPEPMELFAGDLLLTASDGLTDLALARDILGATRQAMASGTIETACQQLVRMANERGGHDNITVQIAMVVGTAQRKTRTGATLAGDVVSPAGHAPVATGSTPGVGHPLSRTQGMEGGQNAGPTTIDSPREGRKDTVNMMAAPTAHDGTSRTSHAAIAGAAAHGHGALPLPPTAAAMSAGLSASLEPPRGLPDYRLDGVGGLQPPPVSVRYVGPQAVQHLQTGAPPQMPAPPSPQAMVPQAMAQQNLAQQTMVSPQMGSAQGMAPPMTPAPGAAGSSPGFGAPPPSQAQGWGQAAPQGQQAGWQSGAAHAPPHAYPHDPGLRPTRPSDAESASGRTGGNVLFLALAISFVVAVVMLVLVWVLFLR